MNDTTRSSLILLSPSLAAHAYMCPCACALLLLFRVSSFVKIARVMCVRIKSYPFLTAIYTNTQTNKEKKQRGVATSVALSQLCPPFCCLFTPPPPPPPLSVSLIFFSLLNINYSAVSPPLPTALPFLPLTSTFLRSFFFFAFVWLFVFCLFFPSRTLLLTTTTRII